MTAQIERIKNKIIALRRKDNGCMLFGASKHRYKLKPTLSEWEILEFEQSHRIRLPEGYRKFINLIGNGGAGPYYGLERLEDGIYADLDYKRPGEFNDLSTEFPFTEAWNIHFKEVVDENDDDSEDKNENKQEDALELHENMYYDPKWANGLLAISNFGCGVSMNLVVNGKEHGHIWVDDRGSDGGIYPDNYFGNTDKIDFLTWYELWLDKSFEELDKMAIMPVDTNNTTNIASDNRPWWKRLWS